MTLIQMSLVITHPFLGNAYLTGTINCEPCPPNMFCSVASSKPIPAYLYSDFVTSTQENELPQPLSAVDVAFVSIIPILLLIIIFVICWGCNKKTRSYWNKILKRLDIFFKLSHYVPHRAAPIKENTRLGGIFTLLVFAVISVILVYTIYTQTIFNTIRTTSFYPQDFALPMTANDLTVTIQIVGTTSNECNVFAVS
jgi:hypothetical protein